MQAAVGVRSPLQQNPVPGLRPPLERLTLWERPWPRHSRCGPSAPIRAAVGVRRPLPQNPAPGSGRRSSASPCGSGLGRDAAAAVRRLRYRLPSGSRPLPQNPAPGSRRRSGASPCGSGLGRDAAAAVRRLRYRLPSGSRPLPQNPVPGSGGGLGAPCGRTSRRTADGRPLPPDDATLQASTRSSQRLMSRISSMLTSWSMS
jgi:hypothetical protein